MPQNDHGVKRTGSRMPLFLRVFCLRGKTCLASAEGTHEENFGGLERLLTQKQAPKSALTTAQRHISRGSIQAILLRKGNSPRFRKRGRALTRKIQNSWGVSCETKVTYNTLIYNLCNPSISSIQVTTLWFHPRHTRAVHQALSPSSSSELPKRLSSILKVPRLPSASICLQSGRQDMRYDNIFIERQSVCVSFSWTRYKNNENMWFWGNICALVERYPRKQHRASEAVCVLCLMW